MNIELIRLGTFVSWPSDAPVGARELSRCGFFVSNNSILQAECAWCHCQISDWKEGDEVWRRHRAISPQCRFLIDYRNCENIALPLFGSESLLTLDFSQDNGNHPMNNQQPESSLMAEMDQVHNSSEMNEEVGGDGGGGGRIIDKSLYVEANRLATFKNWPNPNVTPESLAKVGFYYLNRSDLVQCVWCSGVVAQWEKNDNAFEEHRRLFPKCPRTKYGPLVEIGPKGIDSLGIQEVSTPRNPKYATLHSRLSTFTDWPISDIQRPEDLAKAGLYSDKFRDLVRCFHCNIGLRCWEKMDNPWFEHARWSPNCGFVRLLKGNSFIEDVQNSMKILTPNNILEKAMLSGPVRQALQLSIDYNVIREHMCRHMQKTGLAFSSIEELLQAIFDSEEEEEEQNAGEETKKNEQTDEINGSGSSSHHEGEMRTLTVEEEEQAAVVVEEGEAAAAAAAAATSIPPPAIAKARTVETLPLASLSTGSESETLDSNPASTSAALASSSSASSSVIAEMPPTTSALVKRAKEEREQEEEPLEEETRKLRDEFLCKVCFDKCVNVVYLPCGHLATCLQCAAGVTHCPMCRTEIQAYVRTFLS